MPATILLDLSHTSHTRARTGIQRVARSLWRELGPAAAPVTFDPHERTWRPSILGNSRIYPPIRSAKNAAPAGP